MSWGGEGGSRGWTVATIIVAGIMIAFVVGVIAWGFGILSSSFLNATSEVVKQGTQLANQVANTTVASYSEETVAISQNFTATVATPSGPPLGSAFSAVITILTAIASVLSDPKMLILVIAATLIVIALVMRVQE